MLDPEDTNDQTTPAEGTPPSDTSPESSDTSPAPVKKAAAKRTAKAPAKKAAAKRTTKRVAKTTEAPTAEPVDAPAADPSADPSAADASAAVDAGTTGPPAEPAAVTPPVKKAAPRKRATRKAAPPAPAPVAEETDTPTLDVPVPAAETDAAPTTAPAAPAVLFQAPVKKAAPRKRATRKAAPPAPAAAPEGDADATDPSSATSLTASTGSGDTASDDTGSSSTGSGDTGSGDTGSSETEAGEATKPKSAKKGGKGKKGGGKGAKKDQTPEEPQDDELAGATVEAGQQDGDSDDDAASPEDQRDDQRDDQDSDQDSDDDSDDSDDSAEGEGGPRRRRRRGGRRRRKPSEGNGGGNGGGNAANGSDGSGDADDSGSSDSDQDGSRADSGDGQDDSDGESSGSRRRRRRRRPSDDGDGGSDDPENTVTRVRKPRNPEDEITSIGGSTRLEAKKQRRREGREAGRRRAPIVSEAEFLTRRESVDRVMVIRQHDDLTQIGVLEDKVLVEHYVARESQTSLIGNVYLGRVQNVLPSMEAAFIDIGKGRNAVLYAGEVNWQALGHREGQPRKIESVLSSGQTILVQVTKDPIGHKGARLTGQVSLPGRFLVYVPEGNTSGISRKLPDTERNRLKTLLKEIVPDTAGVIVRTAAEGASEEELTQDVERLTARWGDIEAKVKSGKGPQLLYGEPDLTLKVVRDLFTEDFARLVVQGDDAWDLVDGYVSHVAPDLRHRLERFEPGDDGKDLFAAYRVDEQIAKGLDRKVWLPSGGSLIIDRTEAMTVVDVNTGKFTGSGGNLEETVTKNNLEAAEEIVRQLRLRDIGGIIVVDFIDMVLESNRDLVLRRLVECLGRDRTRHQVAEVTSLGLVQMTRKRIGTGLLEAFSQDCEACKGRGVVVEDQPVDPASRPDDDDGRGRGGRSRGGRSRGGRGDGAPGDGNGNGGNRGGNAAPSGPPSPRDLARTRPPEKSDDDAETGPDESGATNGAAPDTAPDTVADTASGTGQESGPAAGETAPETAPEAAATGVPSSRRRRGGRREQQPAVPAAAPEQATEQATDEAEPQAEQNVIGRPTAQTPEPQHVPSASQGDEPAQEPAQESAGETSEPTSEEPAKGDPGTPAAAAATTPEPPRLVTSTRRRTARRAAGPPTAVQPGAGRQSGPSAEPVDVPVDPAGADSAPLATPDPRVEEHIASAPETASGDQPWPDDAELSGEGAELDEDGGLNVTHVPIKRKRSRRR